MAQPSDELCLRKLRPFQQVIHVVILLNFLGPEYTAPSSHLLLQILTASVLRMKRVDFYTIIRYSWNIVVSGE